MKKRFAIFAAKHQLRSGGLGIRLVSIKVFAGGLYKHKSVRLLGDYTTIAARDPWLAFTRPCSATPVAVGQASIRIHEGLPVLK